MEREPPSHDLLDHGGGTAGARGVAGFTELAPAVRVRVAPQGLLRRERNEGRPADFQQYADIYGAGEGQYPERFAISALVARLLSEQQAATARWAEWAEQVVSG